MAGPPTVRGRIFGVVGAARAGVFGVGCGAKRKSQRSANPGGAKPRPYYIIGKVGVFLRGACLSLVGACIAGPPTVRGCIEGLQVRRRRAEPSPAPTVEVRKGDKNFTHSLAVYCRGGALLHPRGLAAAQGFNGRAMLAPTMKF